MLNIDKSAFRKGQYVGYSGRHVWRITKSNSSFGRWRATTDDQRMPTMFAFTLSEMSHKLETVNDWAERYAGHPIRT